MSLWDQILRCTEGSLCSTTMSKDKKSSNDTRFTALELPHKTQWNLPVNTISLMMDNRKKEELDEHGGVKGIAEK